MTFDATQKEALAAPLSRDNVKTRDQAGRKLSYIESWRAISEANRIFGFDGWNRETIEVKCVAEHARKVGQGEGWGVTYTAKVRVTVGGIVREGVGAGHGIDRDLGQAHESAIKESESDAGKRALMTFGNPFGLALYDKEQAEVESPPKAIPKPPADNPVPQDRATKAREWALSQIPKIKAMDRTALDIFTNKYRQQIIDLKELDNKASVELDKAVADRIEELFA